MSAQTKASRAQRLQGTLPWFRILFGVLGLLSPRLLGRFYGILDPESEGGNEVAIRYACIRALGLGVGQLTAPSSYQGQWQRVGMLVDTMDTIMVLHAGLTGRISKRKALGMLSGTVFGMVVGLLTESQRVLSSTQPHRHDD